MFAGLARLPITAKNPGTMSTVASLPLYLIPAVGKAELAANPRSYYARKKAMDTIASANNLVPVLSLATPSNLIGYITDDRVFAVSVMAHLDEVDDS